MQQYPQPNNKQLHILVLLFIGVVILLSGVWAGSKIESLSHQSGSVVVSFSTPTPTPTVDSGFQTFLDGFNQALQTQDMGTIAADTDQNRFHDWQFISIILGHDWQATYDDLQSGLLSLAIQSPTLYTCSVFNGAYVVRAVMGTYSLHSTASIKASGSGYASFTFEQIEQGGPWLWVQVELNTGQCSQS